MGNLQSLEREGTLSKAEVDRLERRLRRLGRGRAEVARSDLRGVDSIAQNPFMERIFEMYDKGESFKGETCFGATAISSSGLL